MEHVAKKLRRDIRTARVECMKDEALKRLQQFFGVSLLIGYQKSFPKAPTLKLDEDLSRKTASKQPNAKIRCLLNVDAHNETALQQRPMQSLLGIKIR